MNNLPIGTERLCNNNTRWRVKIGPGQKGWKKRAVYRMEQKLGRTIPKGYHVHHKDENPLNDDLDNLEIKKRNDHFSDHNIGEKNGLNKLTYKEVLKIRNLARRGMTQKEIGRIFKVAQAHISNIVRFKRRSKG